jgi:hypothetical protein
MRLLRAYLISECWALLSPDPRQSLLWGGGGGTQKKGSSNKWTITCLVYQHLDDEDFGQFQKDVRIFVEAQYSALMERKTRHSAFNRHSGVE